MPVRVHVEGDLLHIDFSGVITGRDLIDGTAAVRVLEETGSRVPDRTADLSETTAWEIGFAEMDQFVAARKAVTFRNTFKTAIIAPQPVQIGFARMFQLLNNHPQITIEVFSDLASAKAWLATPSAPAYS
jgi:hypothetical protein